jgi:hypothetical protein
MKLRVHLTVLFVAALVCVTSTARADPKSEPPRKVSWGWAVVALSLVTGAAVTAGALSIDCAHDDLECARWASLGIWGGIGIASAGSVAGLLVVKADNAREARMRLSFTVDRSQHGSSMPRATLVCTF